MDRDSTTIVKFITVGLIALIISIMTFVAGFASAYLLVDNGILPTGAVSTIPPTCQPSGASSMPTHPTRTPLPIPTPLEGTESFQIFWEAWDLVQRHFYGELPNMQEVTYAAIRGMLNTVEDDYTAFIEPDVAAVLEEDATGEFEGIGAFVDLHEAGGVRIVDTFEAGPAEEAGLRANDRIIEVDGISILNYTLYEAIGLIRGPAGSEVELLIEREGDEAFEVTVKRARLEIPIVESEMRDDGIGYLSLREFSSTASDRLEEELARLLEQDPKGIVFDLRQNPGGWLDEAINVADIYLEDDLIAIERFSDGDEKEFKAHSGDIGEEVPLVVLVDRGSASASEIVAGALQDQDRAILIGETTFGKGSVQRPFNLSDGSELRVTIALWFTPDNQPIQGHGLTPDIEVPWPEEEDLEPDVDPQLERAVEYLLQK